MKNRRKKQACPIQPATTTIGPSALTASAIVATEIAVSTATDHLAHREIDRARAHPAHGEHVEEPAQRAVPDAVLALPRATRTVRHGVLGHAEALVAEQRRQEPVRAVEPADRARGFGAEDLERATGVADRVLRDPVPDSVPDARRDAADEA